MSTNFYLRPREDRGPWFKPAEVHIGKRGSIGNGEVYFSLQGFDNAWQHDDLGIPQTIASWSDWKVLLRGESIDWSTIGIFDEYGVEQDREEFIAWVDSIPAKNQRDHQAKQSHAEQAHGMRPADWTRLDREGVPISFHAYS